MHLGRMYLFVLVLFNLTWGIEHESAALAGREESGTDLQCSQLRSNISYKLKQVGLRYYRTPEASKRYF